MPVIKVEGRGKRPRPYWPKELMRDGFVGKMAILNDAFTATVIHPKANLTQIKRSLEILLKDIDLRIEKEGAESPVRSEEED